ncbi:PTS sugar transporter subunit IIA [Spirochaetota bacterium]
MIEYLQNIIGKGDEILILALLIITGLVFAEIAKKIHLPKITGYIIAGIIIGNPFLHLISPRNFESLQNINLVALGLMSITIGAHLHFHKLQNTGKRVIMVLIFESSLSFTFVFLCMFFIAKQELLLSLLIASISIATAPVATVATVKEVKAKGLVVNTLLPVVAINNVLCIVIFGIFVSIIEVKGTGGLNFINLLLLFGKELLVSAGVGVVGGFLLKYFAEKNITSKSQVLTLVFLTVLAVTGVSKVLSINLMLPCMVIGMYITNTSEYKARILTIFEEIEYLIMIIFFALAGAHIDMDHLGSAGLISLLYFIARGCGKLIGGNVGAFIANAPKRVYKFIGATLFPQAGVAIGLIILAGSVAALSPVIDFLTTLVLAVVALNELFGPPATKWALQKSGDAGQDRPKLIEFLLEEYINPNLKADNKEDAIREMISFFIKSHSGSKEYEEEILESVFKREEEASTGIGDGVAIPHGIVSEGPIIWGALGLSHEGIDFDSIDGKPAHVIILIVTPRNHKADMHLSILSEISKLLSDNTVLKKVIESKTAAEVCDVLIEKEKEDFNYFLDDD